MTTFYLFDIQTPMVFSLSLNYIINDKINSAAKNGICISELVFGKKSSKKMEESKIIDWMDVVKNLNEQT